MWELLCSLDLQPTMDQVDQGVSLDFAQYAARAPTPSSADAQGRGYTVPGPIARPQSEHDLQTLQDACLRVSHLRSSCLALRRLQLDYQDQRLAREALQQLAHATACLRRSLESFDHAWPDSRRRDDLSGHCRSPHADNGHHSVRIRRHVAADLSPMPTVFPHLRQAVRRVGAPDYRSNT